MVPDTEFERVKTHSRKKIKHELLEYLECQLKEGPWHCRVSKHVQFEKSQAESSMCVAGIVSRAQNDSKRSFSQGLHIPQDTMICLHWNFLSMFAC